MYKTKKTFRKKAKKTYKAKPKVSLASTVNKLILRQVETKMNSTSTSWQTFNSAISVTGDYQYIMPVLNVGTGPNNRIGDSIKPVKIVIEGYVAYNMSVGSQNTESRLIGARLMVFQDKATKAYQNNIFNYNLLDFGGSSENYTGTALNWIAPHNDDQFRFFADKRFKILKPYGYTNTLQGLPATPAITDMNSSLFHKFKIVIPHTKLPATIKYDSTDSSNTPINFSPMITVGYSDLLGFAADTGTQQIGMAYRSTLYFKDI